MASPVDPEVSADRGQLLVPVAAVPHFAVLDRLLTQSVRAASAGLLLGPATQPEIIEMREWLCGQVSPRPTALNPSRGWRAPMYEFTR